MKPDNGEFSTDDHDVINSAEVIDSLGNMILVEINGETKQVSATSKNRLLYEHNLYELLHPEAEDSRIVLNEKSDTGEFVAIAPTNNDSIYMIWVGDNPYPVMNRPSMSEDVLRGVQEMIEDNDYSRIKNVYDEIRSDQVRQHIIEKAVSMYPRSEVIPEEDGWNIMGIFKLTWDTRIYLNGKSIKDQVSYKVRGGVEETDELHDFLKISAPQDVIDQYKGTKLKIHYPLSEEVDVTNNDTVNEECPVCGHTTAYEHEEPHADQDITTIVYVCQSCDQPWEQYQLTEREIQFIQKAEWLLNHREKYDDDAFWSVVENYVMRVDNFE